MNIKTKYLPHTWRFSPGCCFNRICTTEVFTRCRWEAWPNEHFIRMGRLEVRKLTCWFIDVTVNSMWFSVGTFRFTLVGVGMWIVRQSRKAQLYVGIQNCLDIGLFRCYNEGMGVLTVKTWGGRIAFSTSHQNERYQFLLFHGNDRLVFNANPKKLSLSAYFKLFARGYFVYLSLTGTCPSVTGQIIP